MSPLGFLGNLHLPYPDYGHGFWGKQTSTLNFCEEVCIYIYLTSEVEAVRITRLGLCTFILLRGGY